MHSGTKSPMIYRLYLAWRYEVARGGGSGTGRILKLVTRLGLTVKFTFFVRFCHGTTVPTGSRPPLYRGFMITLRHTALGSGTPLYKWSARRRYLYLTTHNPRNKYPYPRRDLNPQSQQRAAADPRLKGAIHSQLNWAILLCDVVPDGKTE